jgi:hypothetical protein
MESSKTVTNKYVHAIKRSCKISKSKYDNLSRAKIWTFVSRFPMTDLF